MTTDSLLADIARMTARHYVELQALILDHDHAAGMRSIAAPVAAPAASDDEPAQTVQAPPLAAPPPAQPQQSAPAALSAIDFSIDDDEPAAEPKPTPAPASKRGRRPKPADAAPVQTALPTAPAAVTDDGAPVLAGFGAVAMDDGDDVFPAF